MTMEIEIKNASSIYIAEVVMMDQFCNPVIGFEPVVLQPGELTTVTVWDGHWPATKEIGEVKAEEPGLSTESKDEETDTNPSLKDDQKDTSESSEKLEEEDVDEGTPV